MTLSPRSALVRPLVLAAALLASLFALPAPAAAQGRCSCNSGCHQYPGQCVQQNASGCDPGFAPFCGTRASTCPNSAWVSCSGDCSCVRVPTGDAGVADASTSDVSRVDGPVPPLDAPPSDVTVVSDRPVSTDADRPVATDADPRVDAPRVSVDAPAATDAGCVCPGGVCIAGVCVTERCTYQPELGFLCGARNTACQLIDGEAFCVPLCLGTSCALGEFCDESSAGRCVRDECATRSCPGGTTCYRNQCGNFDGGVTGAGDAGAPSSVMTAEESGCGCRAAGPGRSMSTAWWGVAALLLTLRRRKKQAMNAMA